MADTKSLKTEQDRLVRREKDLKRDQLRVQEQLTANMEAEARKKEEEVRKAQKERDDAQKKKADLNRQINKI